MAQSNTLNFGALAPDHSLKNLRNEWVNLSSFWAKKTVLLAFTRHLGCSQCKEMVAQLASSRKEIENRGLKVVIITQGTVEENNLFEQTYGQGLEFLSDVNREAYKKYFLPKGSIFQLFLNPRIWLGLRRSISKGYTADLPPKGQDAAQMSGLFIIGEDGTIELPYYYDHIADHPPIELILNGVLSSTWSAKFGGALKTIKNEINPKE